MIRKSECEKLLDVTFDTKLTCGNHITDICSKASWKIYALARVAPYKRRVLMNTFFNSQFNWCPSVGCVSVAQQTEKYTGFMKDVYVEFIIKNSHLLKSS